MLFTRQATERLLGILSKWHAATSCESLQEPKNSEQKRTFLQTDDECYASRQYCLFLTDGSQFGEWNSHQHRVPLHDHTEHFKCYLKKKKIPAQDFPGGSVVKSPPANEGFRDTGFDPRSKKMPHAAEQLSPRATSAEPTCCYRWSPGALELVPHIRRSHGNERPEPQDKAAPARCH